LPVNYYIMYTTIGLGLQLKKSYFPISQVVGLAALHILLIIDTTYISVALKFRSSPLTRPPPETTDILPGEKV